MQEIINFLLENDVFVVVGSCVLAFLNLILTFLKTTTASIQKKAVKGNFNSSAYYMILNDDVYCLDELTIVPKNKLTKLQLQNYNRRILK